MFIIDFFFTQTNSLFAVILFKYNDCCIYLYHRIGLLGLISMVAEIMHNVHTIL